MSQLWRTFKKHPQQLPIIQAHTTGAMLAAAQHAISMAGFACAPVSGFHHACWDHAGGYCTFNGLIVTAFDLIQTERARRVGILDCDQHYGNGIDDIIRKFSATNKVSHHSVGARYTRQHTAGVPVISLKSYFISY